MTTTQDNADPKEAPMKERRITCTWRSTHTVELPDGYTPGGTLDDEWADQVDATTAELTDWEWSS